MSRLQLDDKTVLVTGAAGAIGKGIARAFCEEGASVFITDKDAGAVAVTGTDITAAGGVCHGLAADVTEENQVRAVVDAATQALGGRIDVLVNVAGIVAQGPVEDIDVADWDRVFAVNCRGTFLYAKHVVPLMKRHGYGRIINFSSKSGKTGSALMSHYSGAKAAVMGMTQAWACELADHGITVNCVCPGITDHTGVWTHVSAGYVENMALSREEVIRKFTAKIPLKRLAAIQDVVEVTLFLAGAGADYMTGQSINVTGGREMH